MWRYRTVTIIFFGEWLYHGAALSESERAVLDREAGVEPLLSRSWAAREIIRHFGDRWFLSALGSPDNRATVTIGLQRADVI